MTNKNFMGFFIPNWDKWEFICIKYMCLDTTKSVFRVSFKVRFKPACSATETIQEIGSWLVASLYTMLFKKRIHVTKVLIRWSAPLLFAHPKDRFSHVETHIYSQKQQEWAFVGTPSQIPTLSKEFNDIWPFDPTLRSDTSLTVWW